MSRVSVPYAGDTTPRRTQLSLTDRQTSLVSRLAQDCRAWQEQHGGEEQQEGRAGQARAGREFLAGRCSAGVEGELAREAAAREGSKDRSMREMREFVRGLPCHGMREELLAAVRENQVVVVSGETGCGKTTQVLVFLVLNIFHKSFMGMLSRHSTICTDSIF